jgi:hypothetical protein
MIPKPCRAGATLNGPEPPVTLAPNKKREARGMQQIRIGDITIDAVI